MKKFEDMKEFNELSDHAKTLLKMLLSDEEKEKAQVKYSLGENIEYKLWQAGYKKQEKTSTSHENYTSPGIELINSDDGYLRIYHHSGAEHSKASNTIAFKRMEIKNLTFEAIIAMIDKIKAL